MKLLCTADDIKSIRPMSREISPDRINPFIVEAQENDISRVLGMTLYSDLMFRMDDTLDPMYANYQALLRGEVLYVPTGATYAEMFRGLWLSVAYYAMARFMENNQIHVTRSGVVTKQTPESEQVNPETLQAQVNSLRSNAIANDAEVIKYLNSNAATFVRWSPMSAPMQTGLKWFDL